MTLFETYSLLFVDILVSNLAFTTTTEVAFDTMHIFGQYDIWLMVLVSLFAYNCAVSVNYFFGILCYKILVPINQNKTTWPPKNKYLTLILLLSCLPFWGKFVVLFAGFCFIKFRTVFFIAFASKLVYYAAVLFL